MAELALKIFFDQLNIHANNMLVNVELPPDDLTPPTDVEATVDLLRKLLASHATYDDVGPTERQTSRDDQVWLCIRSRCPRDVIMLIKLRAR